ncbi:MAG: peptidylprolyl isomerase [Gemmataceae bacterium]
MRLLSVAALAVSAAVASAQAPLTPPAGAPGTLPPSTVAPPATTPAPVVRPTGNAATVNNQAIPEVAVYRALRQFPPTEQAVARKEILNHLIDNTLIDQYLNLLKITVEPAEVDKLIGDLKAELAKAVPPKDYAKELEGMMLTEAEFRAEVSAQMKWDKFVKQQATDANLKTLFDQSPTVFDGSLVKCRHILLAMPADAATKTATVAALRKLRTDLQTQADAAAAALPATSDPLQKQQAIGQKLEELFSATAKKSSICPSAKDGGNLDFFPRVGAMVEPFSKVAFELPVYGMSDVVETEFGLHLILVTAKKPGTPKTFDQVKDDVRSLYAFRLREAVVGQMKPKAQIAITPTNPVTPTSGTVAPMK